MNTVGALRHSPFVFLPVVFSTAHKVVNLVSHLVGVTKCDFDGLPLAVVTTQKLMRRMGKVKIFMWLKKRVAVKRENGLNWGAINCRRKRDKRSSQNCGAVHD